MKRIYIILSLIALISSLFSRPIYAINQILPEISDSIHADKSDSLEFSKSLEEVVINASRRVVKGDTLMLIPTAAQRKNAQTSYDMLRSLMIPGIHVDALNGNIKTFDNNGVMLIINGKPATKNDMLALRPTQVARIDYLQNPGQNTPSTEVSEL